MQVSHGFSADIQKFVLAHEGGYVDHPKDPGGATNLGITFKTLQAWRGKKITKQDVKNLSRQEALAIYKAQYWDTMKCSLLPLGLDYMVMDYGVNSGPARSVKDIQRVVGAEPDGVMGVKTVAKIEAFVKVHGILALLERYASRRWAFMQGLSNYPTFGDGWKKRVWGKSTGVQTSDIGVVDRAAKLASGVPASKIPLPEVTVGSAFPEKPTITAMLKDPATLTGAAGAAATVFGAIQDQPVLQGAAVLAIIGVTFFYLKQRQEVDPN